MFRFGLKAGMLALVVVWASGLAAAWPSAPFVGVPGSPVPESPDFATLVLHDSWDMQQYSDVSQYLNQSGQANLVANPAVANGQFTGQSVGSVRTGNNASFWPLFPGYDTAMLIGKVGHRYPIDSALYHCLYIAMKVDYAVNPAVSPDQFVVFWFADQTLNSTPDKWGEILGMRVNPDRGPSPNYQVYKVDLNSPPSGSAVNNARWNSRPSWQGLRIDPTINAGVNFAVDWVRLTTCNANSQTITWSRDSSIQAAWVQDVSAGRWVRVATGLNGGGGSGTIDVEGIPPGSYKVGLGTLTSCCSQISTSPMVIGAAPIADFVSPSYFSGPDYASQAGIPWDFNSPRDVVSAANMSYTIHDSVLDTTIPSGPYDSQFFLNAPQPIAPSRFRYLSFRMFTGWSKPWQNVPQGMIVRFVWGIEGVSGRSSNRCWLVSHDIPFDIGWQTYWIDMGDSFNGAPMQSSVTDCPTSLPKWTSTPPILNLRFDPNEDITGSSFHQEIDWIRLTAVDSVARGKPYVIQLHLNRDISRIAYYYTTNPANPTQALARQYVVGAPVSGPYRALLPLVNSLPTNTDTSGLPVETVSFQWDTSSVSANTYYICAQVTGGGDTTTSCSEAPVIVQ